MHFITDIEEPTTISAPQQCPAVAKANNISSSPVSVNFTPSQLSSSGNHNLVELMRQRTQRREFFYGIELVAHASAGGNGRKSLTFRLDYNNFGTLLPLFTSLVWLWQDSENECPLADAETIRFAFQLRSHTDAVPHFTCYRLDRERLREFLNLNFSNVLVIRGDRVQANQEFPHASDLIEEIRRLRGNSITIGVAAYPEGHPDARTLEEDMNYLLKKVKAGADFIITQACFNSSLLIEFISKCRSKGITIPIMIGVYIPQTPNSLRRACKVMRIRLPTAYLSPTTLSDGINSLPGNWEDLELFRSHAERLTVNLIMDVLKSELDVFGVQFFTMNKLKSVQRVLKEIGELFKSG